MTSSLHDLSDKSKTDEQPMQSLQDISHYPTSNEIVQPEMGMPPADYTLPHNPLALGHVLGQTTYPAIPPFYGGYVAAFGGHNVHPPPATTMLLPGMPLPTDSVEEPVYVNAKQYHGILRRRQSRAKAESVNKLVKSRKPYLHESRHQHALKRARGHGGRFVNSKDQGDGQSPADSATTAASDPQGVSRDSAGGSPRSPRSENVARE